MGANFTFPGGGFYHATKYAVEAISDALRFEVKGFGVDVVDHPAGPDPDRFGDDRDDGDRGARPATGPYADFNAAVAASDARASTSGARARLGGGPEAVAKAIERAITADAPRIRYR